MLGDRTQGHGNAGSEGKNTQPYWSLCPWQSPKHNKTNINNAIPHPPRTHTPPPTFLIFFLNSIIFIVEDIQVFIIKLVQLYICCYKAIAIFKPTPSDQSILFLVCSPCPCTPLPPAMSGISSWLQRQRKGDLIELGTRLGLSE